MLPAPAERPRPRPRPGPGSDSGSQLPRVSHSFALKLSQKGCHFAGEGTQPAGIERRVAGCPLAQCPVRSMSAISHFYN